MKIQQLKTPLAASVLVASAAAFVVDPTPPAATGTTDISSNGQTVKKVASLVQHLVDATRLESPEGKGGIGALAHGLYAGTKKSPLLNSSPELPKNDWEEPNTEPEPVALPEPEPKPSRWNFFNQDEPVDTPEVEGKEEIKDPVSPAAENVVLEEKETLSSPSMQRFTTRTPPNSASVVDSPEDEVESTTANVPSFDELKEQFETFYNEPFTPGQFILEFLPPDTTLSNGEFIVRSFVLFIIGVYLATSQMRLSKMAKDDSKKEAERKEKAEAEQTANYEKEEIEARKMATIYSKDDSFEQAENDKEDDGLEDALTVMEEIDADEEILSSSRSKIPDSTKDPNLYPIDEDDEQDEESEGGTISMSDEESTLQPPLIQRTDVKSPFATIDESSVPSREASSNDSVGSGSLITNCPTGKDVNPAEEDPADDATTPSRKKRFRFPKMNIKSPIRKPKTPRRLRMNKQKTS